MSVALIESRPTDRSPSVAPLPPVEALAGPVVTALLDLSQAFGERVLAADRVPDGDGRRAEAQALLSVERQVADIVATATGRCVGADWVAVESAARYLIEALSCVRPLADGCALGAVAGAWSTAG